MQYSLISDITYENIFILMRENNCSMIDLSPISIVLNFRVWYSQRCIDAIVTENRWKI
jgi:hypothetical protein